MSTLTITLMTKPSMLHRFTDSQVSQHQDDNQKQVDQVEPRDDSVDPILAAESFFSFLNSAGLSGCSEAQLLSSLCDVGVPLCQVLVYPVDKVALTVDNVPHPSQHGVETLNPGRDLPNGGVSLVDFVLL